MLDIIQGQVGEKESNDEPAPNRFSAVIEKIERLYMVFVFFIMFASIVRCSLNCLYVNVE